MNKTTLEKILEATKLTGEQKEVLVSEIYVDIIAKRKYALLSTIKKLDNTPVPEETVQKAYKKETKCSSKFVELYNATGIRPPEEVIQEAYLKCIRNIIDLSEGDDPNYRKFKQLIKTFNSKPSQDVLYLAEKSCYFEYTSYGSYGSQTRDALSEESVEELAKILKKVGVDFQVSEN